MASDRIGRDLILVLLFVSESSRVRGILYVTSHINPHALPGTTNNERI